MGGETSARDSQSLVDLCTRRSSVKGQITKFKNFIQHAGTKERLTPDELAELSLRLGKFESLSGRFDDLQSQIEVLNPTNLSSELDERDEIEQLFISHIALAQSLVQKQNAQLRQDESLNSSHLSSAQSHIDQESFGFKLPQIQIAKFDGSFFRWLEFRDTFLSIVHNNERIAPIHKFHYLISYLTGDAARIISNFEVSSANYKNAWKLLCERYDNKRQLINHHLNSLFSIEPVTRDFDKSLKGLVDNVSKNLRALCSLGLPTDQWDVLIVHMMSSKLDNNTRVKWEEWRGTLDEYPTLKQFKKFLIDRADVLSSIHHNSNAKPTPSTSKASSKPQTKSFACASEEKSNTATSGPLMQCVICHEGHRIYDCPTFMAKSVEERIAEVRRLKLCFNCLRPGHYPQMCPRGPCRVCKGRHNSLIHKPDKVSTNNASISSAVEVAPDSADDTSVNFSNQSSNQVLLSTAFIEVANPRTKQAERIRCLLDCGSQSSFITQSLKDKLGLPSNSNCLVNVLGIGNQNSGQVTESCVAQLKSLINGFKVTSGFLVLPQITGDLPRFPIDASRLKIANNIKLADPMFYQPAPTDILIGADLFWDILGREQQSLGPNNPKLVNSQFGWIISGPISASMQATHVRCNHSIISSALNDEDIQMNRDLAKFWELEEVPLRSTLSESEKACESHFVSHTFRLDTGRFSVALPLRDSADCLGQSYNAAKKRLLNLEKRFRKQPDVKSQYVQFMREYSDLGHLSESPIAMPHTSYFLCHHAVFKDSSESTKIRVVFDGSAPTSSGYSINDILWVGPNMQDSLFSILIRARFHKYLLTGDVEKMYRQVLIKEEDRDLQLILFREDESLPIKTYRLNTITYGMASSSYLSTRCLWQLGEECTDPAIKDVIQRDFYIDDLITGSENESDLRYIHQSVSAALQKGCFNLRKFKTNLPAILDSTINSNDNLIVSESSSTLGMGWNPSTDQLHFPFKVPPPSDDKILTKRLILSSLFKIFDPLGLLSPCVIKAKMLLQQLWLQKLGWDDPVPIAIQRDWNKFAKTIPTLLALEVSRRVLCDNPVSIELHSFSDASQNAYGACIYLRTEDAEGNVTVNLLCSKSKESS